MADANMKGELVLVTGATGRTGVVIVYSLLQLGCKVRVLSRTKERAEEKLSGIEGYELVLGDVAKREDAARALKPAADGTKVSRIIYAAGGEQVVFEDVNGKGPGYFAEEGVKQGVKQMILISAGWVSKPYSLAALLFNSIYYSMLPMAWHLIGEDAMRKSGIDFTIVRAGALIDDGPKAPVGVKLGQGDAFGFREGGVPGMSTRQLAEVCVQAVQHCKGRVTFEVIGDKKAADCRAAALGPAEFGALGREGEFVEPKESPLDMHKRAVMNVWRCGLAIPVSLFLFIVYKRGF